MLPPPYQSEDGNRITLGFFALGSLAIVGGLDRLDQEERTDYIDWIYRRWDDQSGGFSGAPILDLDLGPDHLRHEQPHLVHTYTALLILALLTLPSTDRPKPENPYLNLDLPKLLAFVKNCQRPDGSFASFPNSPEQDVRFVYSAVAILAMVRVDPRTVIDVDSTLRFLKSCRRYEGGYGRVPHSEAQGGTTYCALASLALLSALESGQSDEEADETTRWLVARQLESADVPQVTLTGFTEQVDHDPQGRHQPDQDELSAASPIYQVPLNLNHEPPNAVAGFQGRIGKPSDACYSFWCTAALTILTERTGRGHLSRSQPVDQANQTIPSPILYEPLANIKSLLLCQSKQWGGLARSPDDYPDLYHTYLALASLSISQKASLVLEANKTYQVDPDRNDSLGELMEHDPLLNVPKKASEWIYNCFSPE